MFKILLSALFAFLPPALIYADTNYDSNGFVTTLGTNDYFSNISGENINITYGNLLSQIGAGGGSVFSTAAWVDCIATADSSNASICSGSTTTTTGSITSGTKTLSVSSTTGWIAGMGIAIKNAGTGGTTEHISYVDSVVGTTITIHDNAITTVTGQTINHDDTRAIIAALASGKNVHARASTYPVTSEINVPKGVWLQGDGALNIDTQTTTQNKGTIFLNRGTTNNVFRITDSSTIMDGFAIQQDSSITPTAGYGINFGATGSTLIFNNWFSNITMFGVFNDIRVGPKVLDATFENIWISPSGLATSESISISNPSPAGDIHWHTLVIQPKTTIATGNPCLHIYAADVQSFDNLKINNCDPALVIADTSGSITNQLFTHFSIEGGAATQDMIQLSSAGTDFNNVTFTGGEIGFSNGTGTIYGLSIATKAANVSVVNTTLHSLANGINVNNSGGGGNINLLGNTYEGIGTTAVNVGSGASNLTIMGTIASGSLVNTSNVPIMTFLNGNVKDLSTQGNIGIGTVLTGNAGLSVMRGNVGIGTWKPNDSLIVTTGNVGIGSLSPGKPLDVQGTIRATGFQALAGGVSSPSYGDKTSGDEDNGWNFRGTGSNVSVDGVINGSNLSALNVNGFQMKSDVAFAWSSGDPTLVAGDTGLSRGAASTIYIGNGTAANSSGKLIVTNIGIGSTTPGAAIDVAGTGSKYRARSADGTIWNCQPANSTGVFTCV